MKTITFNHLSLYQTQVCKGIAILFIVIHNFLSKLDPAPWHNEFSFESQRFFSALTIIQSDPSEFFRVFMTFLGHYGVQVFIFLSAYGLVRSIDTQPNTWVAFMGKRIKQLILPMILVMSFYLILDHYFDGIFSVRMGTHDYVDVLKRLLFIANFYPDQAFLVIGPWWFLSLIMQFYCVFILMRKMQLRFGNISLLILSIGAIALNLYFYDSLVKNNIYLGATLLGHLPEFALGMYVASLDKIKIPLWLIVIAVIGLMIGNINEYMWYLAPVFAVIVIMFLCGLLFKYMPHNHRVNIILNYIGVLSVYMFLLNGIIREPFIFLMAKNGYDVFSSLIFTAVITFLCIVFAYLFYQLDTLLQNRIINTKNRKR